MRHPRTGRGFTAVFAKNLGTKWLLPGVLNDLDGIFMGKQFAPSQKGLQDPQGLELINERLNSFGGEFVIPLFPRPGITMLATQVAEVGGFNKGDRRCGKVKIIQRDKRRFENKIFKEGYLIWFF